MNMHTVEHRLKRTAAKYAYAHKNLRRLLFEDRVVLISSLVTALFCFFPWISVEPFSQAWSWRSAFGGEIWLMGTLLFLLNVGTISLYVDDIMETHAIKLPFDRAWAQVVLAGAGLVLVILSWSVLLQVAQTYSSAEIRFGIAVCVVAQVLSCVANYLLLQKGKQTETETFFGIDPTRS